MRFISFLKNKRNNPSRPGERMISYKKCKVSVIVPTYNREKYIRRCVDSIVNQTMPHEDYEIIIVDDKSTDSTFSILLEYQARFPDLVRLFQLPENSGGASAPRNKGLDVAQGHYVLLVDSDDYIIETTLRNCYDFGLKNDSDLIYIKNFGKVPWPARYGNIARADIYKNWLISALGINKAYRRKKIEDLNLRFDLKYVVSEDIMFNMIFLCNAEKISLLGDDDYYGRVDTKNSLAHKKMPRELYNEIYVAALHEINASKVLSDEGKNKTAGMFIRRILKYSGGCGWLRRKLDRSNLETRAAFNDLSSIINSHLPKKADKYCTPELWLTLAALRNGDFDALIKYTSNISMEFTSEQKKLLDAEVERIRLAKLPLESISNETVFQRYILLLKAFESRLTVLLSVKDTPSKKRLNEEYYKCLIYLGFKTDLFDKTRASYIGIIKSGASVKEIFDSKNIEPIRYIDTIAGRCYELTSGSFNAGNISEIKINGNDYSPNERGLNFVVLDNKNGQVIDAVDFDVWENFKCLRFKK